MDEQEKLWKKKYTLIKYEQETLYKHIMDARRAPSSSSSSNIIKTKLTQLKNGIDALEEHLSEFESSR